MMRGRQGWLADDASGGGGGATSTRPLHGEAPGRFNLQAIEEAFMLGLSSRFSGPLITGAAQPSPLQTVAGFLDEQYDAYADASISVQDPA
jgi:hypothetical protein